MSRSRPLAALLLVGVLGIATAGVGAGASFTDSVREAQTITAGKINMQISSLDGSWVNVSPDGKSVTLPAPAAVGSTFETPEFFLKITNAGDIPVHAVKIAIAESHNPYSTASNALATGMNICVRGQDYTGGPWIEGNGPLGAAVALGVVQNPTLVKPGEYVTLAMSFYAGQDSTHCVKSGGGTWHSDGSNTRAAWDRYMGHAYQTPAALTEDAQGGVVTPTVSFSFEG